MKKKRIPEDQYPKDLQYDKGIYELYFIFGYLFILFIFCGGPIIAWIITEATVLIPLAPVIALFSVFPLSILDYLIHFFKERKKFRKEYFKKMQNVENAEELILEKVEEVKNTQNRDKSITEQREDLNALKDNLNQMKVMNNLKIEQAIEQNTEINRIWNEICHERYIYDVDLNSPLNLTLNKK